MQQLVSLNRGESHRLKRPKAPTHARIALMLNISAITYAMYGTTNTKTGATIRTRCANLQTNKKTASVALRRSPAARRSPCCNRANDGKHEADQNAAECHGEKRGNKKRIVGDLQPLDEDGALEDLKQNLQTRAAVSPADCRQPTAATPSLNSASANTFMNKNVFKLSCSNTLITATGSTKESKFFRQ